MTKKMEEAQGRVGKEGIKNKKGLKNIGKKIIGGLGVSILLFTASTSSLMVYDKVQAEETQTEGFGDTNYRAKVLSKNGKVHEEMYEKIKKNMGDYVYTDGFQLTRYTPRDGSFSTSANESSEKDKANGSYTSTYWMKKDGKWVYSTTSYVKLAKVQKAFKGKFEQKNEKVSYNGGKYDRFKLTFSGDVDEKSRKKYINTMCNPSVQANTKAGGLPFQGSLGKTIEWGNIAIDKKVLKQGADYFIENYGYANARDVGGAVKGKHIDLYWDDCDAVFTSGGTKNNQIVIMKKSDAIGVDTKALTQEVLDKVNKSKLWGTGGEDVSLSGGDESSSKASESKSSGYKDWNPFVKREIGLESNIGKDNGTSILPSELSNAVYVGLGVLKKVSIYLMVVLALVLVLFYTLQVATIVLVRSGTNWEKAYSIHDKIFGYYTTADEYIKILVKNFILIVFLIGFAIGGMYPSVQLLIYEGVESFIRLVGL